MTCQTCHKLSLLFLVGDIVGSLSAQIGINLRLHYKMEQVVYQRILLGVLCVEVGKQLMNEILPADEIQVSGCCISSL